MRESALRLLQLVEMPMNGQSLCSLLKGLATAELHLGCRCRRTTKLTLQALQQGEA